VSKAVTTLDVLCEEIIMTRYLLKLLAIAFATFLFLETNAAAEPQLIIEDNDFMGPAGTNIQSAMVLIGSPGVRVLGFTVVTGDAWRDEEVAYLLRFLEIAQRTDLPVIPGAVVPLVNSRDRMLAWEHMYGQIPWKGAWGNILTGVSPNHPTEPDKVPPLPHGNPTHQASVETAANFLISQVHRYPHQVTILAAGPLTNIALAIRLDPSFAVLAKELIFMGAMMRSTRPDIDPAETFDFNVMFDPEAAHIALTAPWVKITAVGNVTLEAAMTPQLIARIAAKSTPVTRLLEQFPEYVPLWDEMTAAIATDPSLITQHSDVFMDVDLERGPDYGIVHIWPEALAPHVGERKVTLVEHIDVARFLKQFVAAVQWDKPNT
jgi:inosine-uridine nucleoside N-ribohydrolase